LQLDAGTGDDALLDDMRTTIAVETDHDDHLDPLTGKVGDGDPKPVAPRVELPRGSPDGFDG
jgi:hypothetical protein